MILDDELEALRSEYGPWTAHNLELRRGVFTISPTASNRVQERAALYWKLWKIFGRRRSYPTKVLDLGCLEGGISISLAQEGCHCTGVDVRASHLAKARFAANALNLRRHCKWIQGDVTDDSLWRNIGQFDVVVCSGLLYHLDAADLIPLMQRLRQSCRNNGIVIVDTNISSSAQTRVQLPGLPDLWGCEWKEHHADSTHEERMAAAWSSMNNDRAFWLTERSLTNALVHSGFNCVIKPLYPYHEWGHQTRDVWIGLPAKSTSANQPLKNEPDVRPLKHPGLA